MAIGGSSSLWKHGTLGSPSSNTDYSAYAKSVSLSADGEEVDATVFGDTYRDFEQSYKNATIDVEYKYHATIYTAVTAVFNGGTEITWEYGPAGNTSGYAKMTGSAVVTKVGLPTQVGDLITLTATYRVTGAITFTTY